MGNIILVPDYDVFKVAFLEKNDLKNIEGSCSNLFKLAWTIYNDSREKIIWISRELNERLIEEHYISEKHRRLALFSIISVFPEEFGCNHDDAQLRVASTLNCTTDNSVYYVTDNVELKPRIDAEKIGTPISSKEAIDIIKKAFRI